MNTQPTDVDPNLYAPYEPTLIDFIVAIAISVTMLAIAYGFVGLLYFYGG